MPTGDSAAILSTAPAGPSERRLAMLVAAASLAMFLVMAPFAKLQLPQVWAFIPSMPSLATMGTMTNAAIGSAHHNPNPAFKRRPTNRITDKYIQKSVCLASACIGHSQVLSRSSFSPEPRVA